ncbi:MAG: hypothetical protein F4Y01_01805 [Gammaproteobacteria bacterium]|nr:hypothetical protein [Gammaproteobacteria bacterium]
MAAPVPKTNELFEALGSLSAEDELSLRRVENKARKLIGVLPSGGHSVLGAVSAIRGDRERSIHHHEISVRLGADVAWWLSYCTSLAVLDDAPKRLEVARRAIAQHADVNELLDIAIGAALESAAFGDARTLCDQWAKLNRRRHSAASVIGKLLHATENGLFSVTGVRGVLEVAREVGRAKGIQKTEQGRISEPPGNALLWTFQVTASPSAAAELNEELADQLAARDDLLEDPGQQLVVMFDGVT